MLLCVINFGEVFSLFPSENSLYILHSTSFPVMVHVHFPFLMFSAVVMKCRWLWLLSGYKWMFPLEMGGYKMAEHVTGRNTCFLLLIQQVDSESTETILNKSWAHFFVCKFLLLGEE